MCYGSEANNNLYCSSTLTSLAILLGHWLMAYNTGYICKLKIFSFILTEPVLQFMDILVVHSFLYSINHWDGSSYCLPGKLCKILIKISNIFGD